VENLSIALSFDYSQVEVRWLAEVSKDKLLISQFQSGQDIHSLIGNTLTGWSVERIKKEKNIRRIVKNIVFAIIYGVNRDGLYDYIVKKIRSIDGINADLTGITPTKTVKLYDLFFKRYTGVKNYIDYERNNVETKGYVETLFGFRREIRKVDDTRSSYWGNQAINTPIQSGAHQLVLIALALLHMKPRTYNMLQRYIAEIHDQLVFFVKLKDLQSAYSQGRQLLEQEVVKYTAKHFHHRMQVPLISEAEAGFCFGSFMEYNGETWQEFLPKWRAKHLEVEAKGWAKLLE
jgi:DNA polymerase-1